MLLEGNLLGQDSDPLASTSCASTSLTMDKVNMR